ncbi:MAG: hypothetical protein HRT68_16800 [Flavobacteriaceae bacterium]|nr:hypothetical protein [Flavobacteriaceae bacterium]
MANLYKDISLLLNQHRFNYKFINEDNTLCTIHKTELNYAIDRDLVIVNCDFPSERYGLIEDYTILDGGSINIEPISMIEALLKAGETNQGFYFYEKNSALVRKVCYKDFILEAKLLLGWYQKENFYAGSYDIIQGVLVLYIRWSNSYLPG